MLFKRRSDPAWHEQVRVWLWPRRSFSRSGQYALKRILRVNATPHAIAVGVACGTFISFTPLLGFHFLSAALLAWILGGNIIASALGTFVGNPVTFPVIWALTYRVGRVILGEPVHHDAHPPLAGLHGLRDYTLEAAKLFLEQALPLLKPMLVGAVPLGLTAALGMYLLTRWTVLGYQKARTARLAARAARHRPAVANSVAAAEAGEDR